MLEFQITLDIDKKSTITPTDLQFGYIIAALLLQVVIAIIFGNSGFGQAEN